jgi:hypothetical protein
MAVPENNERRRFQVGDMVRFKAGYNTWRSFDVSDGEIGTVSGVESDPPATGPTYRISVQFLRDLIPGVFEFEYELVQPATVDLEARGTIRSSASGSMDGLGWLQRDDSDALIARQEAVRRRRAIAAQEFGSTPPLPPLNTTHTLQGAAFVETAQKRTRQANFIAITRERPREILGTVQKLLSEISIEIEELRANTPNEQEKQKAQNEFIASLENIATGLRQMADELDRAIAANPAGLPEPFFQGNYAVLAEAVKIRLDELFANHVSILADLTIRVPLAVTLFNFLSWFGLDGGTSSLISGIVATSRSENRSRKA